MNPREALVALNLLPDIGPVRVRNLLDKFGSATEILKAPEGALVTVDKVGPKPSLSPAEQSVYNVLTHEEKQQDEIIRRSEVPAAQVSVALLQLEMKQLVNQYPGRLFTRAR